MELSQPALDQFMSASDHSSMHVIMLLLKKQFTEEEANDKMRQYCLESHSDRIKKTGMEFLYMHGFYEDLQQLIYKNRSSQDLSRQNWALVYQYMLDRHRCKVTPPLLMERFNAIRTSDPELACLVDFGRMSIELDTGNFDRIGKYIQKNYKRFEEIQDVALLDFFQTRMQQNLFVYYWHRNELIIARKLGFQALTRTKNMRTKISIHANLGLTYLFDTYEQAFYHMQEGLKLAVKHGYKDLEKMITEHNIPFLAAEFGITDHITTSDASEQAHLAIAEGNYEKARHILNDIPSDTPFRLYYLGCATQDPHMLMKSYGAFIQKKSDYFFSRLPLRALQKLRS
ncbi:hypothetical protein JNUCC1_01174 [Lentibacillus sp. JNUCC-1]|uniref:AimR family lysis-lysogeny pheromone receptor n=1 Tax=Lentibacillus sp. JNUCC-1 TaxID=2654513 RepID=UPI0012E8C359|nr:AimR family lysis-lysogeny pheromone receptor [Lentibacillus sp. JNUCC-1]MUV37368.1 hypothetical protein [Lentibacillus sp. JNUCC-1]